MPPCTMPNSACPGFAPPIATAARTPASSAPPSAATAPSRARLPCAPPAARCTRRTASGCRPKQALDLDRPLRRQHVLRPVDVRLERAALLRDLADLRQAHHLEAAAIGQDRAVPAHELMQATEPRDALRAGPQHQVIGIAEQDVGAGFLHLLGIERLHRRHRADRHERGRADDAARRHDLPEPSVPVLLEERYIRSA